MRCFRCPKAYHLKCRPRDLHNLSLGLFLCIAHVNEDFELPPLPPELNPVKRNRPDCPQLTVDVDFRPGVIVQLDRIAPGTHMFSIKDAIKSIADVRFIEFNEKGATSALARFF